MNNTTLHKIIKNIDSLAPLSDTANLVHALYTSKNDDGNLRKLVRIIESDALLTANILKMINSAYYGFRNKINSITQAVMLFGTHKIYALVIKYAMFENLKTNTTDVYGFTSAQFNDLCHLQHSFVIQWYSKISLRDAQFASSLALIMETGKLVLANEVSKSSYVGEFRKMFNECENIEEFEKSIIGNTSYYLSALLFEHWNLDPKYVSILKALDSDEECDFYKAKDFINILKVTRIVINLKDILSDDAIRKASWIVREMNLSVVDFEQVAYRVRDKYLSRW